MVRRMSRKMLLPLLFDEMVMEFIKNIPGVRELDNVLLSRHDLAARGVEDHEEGVVPVVNLHCSRVDANSVWDLGKSGLGSEENREYD